MSEPKKTKRKTARRKRPEPPKDQTGDALCYCGQRRMPGSEFCTAHTVHDFLSDGSRRAAKKGNLWEALAYGLGAAVTDNIHRHDLGQKAFMVYQMRKQQMAAKAAQEAAARKASAASVSDPFKVLRLDPNTATVEDVRRVQRALAELYHGDKAAGGVDGGAMAEINAAAQAAIKAIKAR